MRINNISALLKLAPARKWFFIHLNIIFLTACGFHLPQHYELPPQLQNVYVTSNNAENANFAAQLKTRLADASVSTVSSADQAQYLLHILNITASPNTLSSSTTGQISTYNLVYTVTFDLTDAKGKVLLPSQTVQSNVQYTISTQQLLSNFNQDENYRDNLQPAAINQILFRLSSQQMRNQLSS